MKQHAKNFWRKRSLGLSGVGTYGLGTKASLLIGRKTGLNYSGWREGETINPVALVSAVANRRAKQVGLDGANLSAVDQRGRYQGEPEPSVRVDMIWIPSKREPSRAAFYKNIRMLAQQVAGDLAQREVIVEWDSPDRRGRVDTASPSKAPAPTSDKFCTWVRKHSRRAQRDKADGCYEE